MRKRFLIQKHEKLVRSFLKEHVPVFYKEAKKKGIPMSIDRYVGCFYANLIFEPSSQLEQIIKEEIQIAVTSGIIPQPNETSSLN